MKRAWVWGVVIAVLSGAVGAGERVEAAYPLMVLVKNIVASSSLRENNASRYAYHVTNLYDDEVNTAWFEGVGGEGVGEYVEMTFFTPIDVSSVSIANGYGKSSAAFTNNARVKALAITANNKTTVLNLQDNPHTHRYALDLKQVDKIRLTIQAVYPGEKYKDTGLSEIALAGGLSTQPPTRVSLKKISQLYEIYYSGVSYDSHINEVFSKFTPGQVEAFLSKEFDSHLDGVGNDDRMGVISTNLIANPVLIPSLLKSALEAHPSIFYSESSSADTSAMLAQLVWGDNVSGVPFVKKKMKGNYASYYWLLDKGDTRVLPQYLQMIAATGIWHDFCCDLMPSEILVAQADPYSMTLLSNFLDSPALDDVRDVEAKEGEVYEALSKALAGMKNKLAQ